METLLEIRGKSRVLLKVVVRVDANGMPWLEKLKCTDLDLAEGGPVVNSSQVLA